MRASTRKGRSRPSRSRTGSPGKLVLALNATIPHYVAVLEAAEVPDGFHARFSAVSKTYRYTILNDRVRRPLLLNQVYHFPQPLEVRRKMNKPRRPSSGPTTSARLQRRPTGSAPACARSFAPT